MTTHYVDFKIKTDSEHPVPIVIGMLFQKFHIALVKNGQDKIGISFPEYNRVKRRMGDVMRLHGDELSLFKFMNTGWHRGFIDYFVDKCPEVKPIPVDEVYGYRSFFRYRKLGGYETRIKKHMEHFNLDFETAKQQIDQRFEKQKELPYLQIRSTSTAQKFSLFIEQSRLQKEPVTGTFCKYGLSKEVTIPVF